MCVEVQVYFCLSSSLSFLCGHSQSQMLFAPVLHAVSVLSVVTVSWQSDNIQNTEQVTQRCDCEHIRILAQCKVVLMWTHTHTYAYTHTQNLSLPSSLMNLNFWLLQSSDHTKVLRSPLSVENKHKYTQAFRRMCLRRDSQSAALLQLPDRCENVQISACLRGSALK